MQSTGHKTKVFWKPEEVQKMAEHLRGVGAVPGGRGFLAAARSAQGKILPPDRHKLLKNTASVARVVEAMRVMPIAEEAAEVLGQQAAITAAPKVSAEPSVDDSLRAAMSAVSTALVTMFFDILEESMAEQAKTRIPGLLRSVLPSTLDELAGRPKKLRVLIVGLRDNQKHIIESEFGSDLDLRFWYDEDYGLLRDRAKYADHVISFLSNIGHKTSDSLRKLGKKPEHNPGGLDGLRTRLTRLYNDYVDGHSV